MDARQTPEANLLVSGEVSHKQTLTELEVRVRHGHNVKLRADKSKELLLAGFVAHSLQAPKAAVRFDLKAVYPDKVRAVWVRGEVGYVSVGGAYVGAGGCVCV